MVGGLDACEGIGHEGHAEIRGDGGEVIARRGRPAGDLGYPLGSDHERRCGRKERDLDPFAGELAQPECGLDGADPAAGDDDRAMVEGSHGFLAYAASSTANMETHWPAKASTASQSVKS